MAYLNLYIAHLQLTLNFLGISAVWPEFITRTFINSFCWSGCTKGLWGGETWVFAEKTMSRGLRACLTGQSYVSLYMSAISQAHSTLSDWGCCLQVSAVGSWWGALSPHVLWGHICPASWAAARKTEMAWDELKAGHVLFSEYFHLTLAKSHPRSTVNSNTSAHLCHRSWRFLG